MLHVLGLLAVQELLVPLVDLLLPAHEVVLPQDDVALVVLDQQPAHVGHHKDEKAEGDPAAAAPAVSGQDPHATRLQSVTLCAYLHFSNKYIKKEQAAVMHPIPSAINYSQKWG